MRVSPRVGRRRTTSGSPGAPTHGRGDAGFTLVELMVAITVLAIGIVSLMTVMSSSMGVTVRTSRRSTAVNLATQAIEATRAIPYTSIPVLAASATTTTMAPQTVKGTTYTISGATLWYPDDSHQEYKIQIVDVRWTDNSGTHDVSQTTKIYPGDKSPSTTTTIQTGGCGTPAAPTAVVANVPLDLSGTTGVDITWTPPLLSNPTIADWVVQWSSDAGTTWNTVAQSVSATVTSMRVSGLSSGTSYKFRVASQAVCTSLSAWSPIATATTLTNTTIGCSPGALSVTPSAVTRASGSSNAGLSTRPVVALNTTGTCTSFTVRYSPTTGDNRVLALVNQGNGVWSAGLAGTTTAAWDVGQHPIDLYDSVNTKRGTAVLTVCEHNVKVCS